MKLSIALAFLVLLTSPTWSTDEGLRIFTSRRWYVPPSSPLRFYENANSGQVKIDVRVDAKTSWYQFECVTLNEAQTPVKIKGLARVRISLPVEQPIFSSTNIDQLAENKCPAEAKIAIVAIEFDDTGVWKLLVAP